MLQEHAYFRLPDDPETKVWRYLSFTKYVSLLQKRALHFARSDQFDDPFEGTVPERARAHMQRFLEPLSSTPEQLAEEFIRLADTWRLFTYINCWHANATESDAMWRLYAFATEGVAVQSTVGRLRHALGAVPEPIYLGAVNYADFDAVDPGVFFNGVTPFIFKRASFEHEREIRAVIWMDHPESAAADGETVQLHVPREVVKAVPVDLEQLVERVVVSPVAPGWFAELVSAITRQHGLQLEVTQSRLYAPPARREQALAATRNGATTFSITREVVEHLHQQHLQYTELQLREKERLAQRQSEAIKEWLDGVERDLSNVRLHANAGDVCGREALPHLAREIRDRPLDQVLGTDAFQTFYLLCGRLDNVWREIDRSVLPPAEKELLTRRMVFFYTEALFRPQITLMAKVHREATSPDAVPEDARGMIGLMFQQHERMSKLMHEARI